MFAVIWASVFDTEENHRAGRPVESEIIYYLLFLNLLFCVFYVPTIYILGIDYEFVKSSRGGQLLMVQGYTFARINRMCYIWMCSSKSSQCKAKVRMNASNEVTDYDLSHNHSPPKYFRMKDGTLIKS